MATWNILSTRDRPNTAALNSAAHGHQRFILVLGPSAHALLLSLKSLKMSPTFSFNIKPLRPAALQLCPLQSLHLIPELFIIHQSFLLLFPLLLQLSLQAVDLGLELRDVPLSLQTQPTAVTHPTQRAWHGVSTGLGARHS